MCILIIPLSCRRRSSHLAIVVVVCVLFVATNIEPPYVFPHVYVYDGSVSVVATLDMIKVAAIASSMVHGGNKYELYHCDAARGKQNYYGIITI